MNALSKKAIVPMGSVLLSGLYFVNNALASGSALYTGAAGNVNATATGTLGGNITTIINYFLGMLGLVAVAFLIYAGVLMVTAGGNEEAIQKARKIITYGVIGLIIVILSYTIVTFVSSALG